jgi:hypothetical protein
LYKSSRVINFFCARESTGTSRNRIINLRIENLFMR